MCRVARQAFQPVKPNTTGGVAGSRVGPPVVAQLWPKRPSGALNGRGTRYPRTPRKCVICMRSPSLRMRRRGRPASGA